MNSTTFPFSRSQASNGDITSCLKSRKGTPEVAQDMRENAAAMDKLIAANRKTPPKNMTAVEDLKMYQNFAQAHVDGLKNLISSFDKLYAGMPDAQKKIADVVFSSSRT